MSFHHVPGRGRVVAERRESAVVGRTQLRERDEFGSFQDAIPNLLVRVQRNFVVVQYIEVAVIVIAAITAFAQKSRFWVAGVALGLLLNAALLLAFDLVAERRGAAYLAAIHTQAQER